jgi:hypothetical protein
VLFTSNSVCFIRLGALTLGIYVYSFYLLLLDCSLYMIILGGLYNCLFKSFLLIFSNYFHYLTHFIRLAISVCLISFVFMNQIFSNISYTCLFLNYSYIYSIYSLIFHHISIYTHILYMFIHYFYKQPPL